MTKNNKDRFNESVISLLWFGIRLISTTFILGVVYILVWGIESIMLLVLEKSMSGILSQSTKNQELFNTLKFGCGFITGFMYLVHNIFGFIGLIKLELEALKDD